MTQSLIPQPDPGDLPAIAVGLTRSVNELAEQVKRSERRTIALAVSLFLDIALTLAITVLGFNVRERNDCQAQENDAFRTAVDHVRDADEDFNERELASYDAQLALLNASLNPRATQAQKIAATNTYRQDLINAKAAIVTKEQASATNPIPKRNCT